MSSPQPQETGFWSWVGKIAVLLGLIYGVIQIVQSLATKSEDIVITGVSESISLPPLYKDLTDLRNDEAIRKEVIDSLPETLGDTRLTAARSLVDIIEKRYGSPIRKLNGIRSVWTFDIENKGNKEAAGLQLEVPFSGIYELTKSGEESKTGDFTDVIPLGTLRASNRISVRIWSVASGSYLDEEKCRVTYPEGVVNASFPVEVTGWMASVYQFGVGGFLFSLMALILAVTGILISLMIRDSFKKTPKPITETPASITEAAATSPVEPETTPKT